MTTVQTVFEALDRFAPVSGKESWDNVGLLVGHTERPVSKVLVALDVTPRVIDEAARLGAELIVSHHPVIFESEKSVTDRTLQGQKILSLAEHGLAAICMHTNLDLTKGGVDDLLAQTLGLRPIGVLSDDGVGRISELPSPLPLPEFLSRVKTALHAGGLRYVEGGGMVRRIATGCGSCGDYLPDALRAGCDTFLTADLKYNVLLDAEAAGLNLIDAGHFATEYPICSVLAALLHDAFPDVEISIARSSAQPERFYI